MGEAFYVGHLLDHAHLSRRDKAMIKTKAGTDVDEHLVTCAMVELATELEGEPGYPLGMSEPNMAKNGEEWLLQRGDTRSRLSNLGGSATNGRQASGTPGGRLARHSFAAEGGEGYELFEDEPGEEDYEEADIPPELLMRENEAFGMHYKAKQKIAEVKKLRQYYRKPDNDTKRKALAEQMKVNPCHNCGELGHWSRECPHPKGGSTSKPQQVLVARTRQLPKVPEEEDDREWDLLVSLCRAEPTSSGGSQRGPSPQYKVRRAYPALGVIEVEGYDVLWSVQDLAFKIILDIGCMRSVAGVQWANLLVARWRREDRWFRVDPETETFKFGGGELLRSRFRLSFVGSFAGKPVVFAFSIVEGSCPPLFSRSGCTQLAAVIDCERHVVSSRKLGVKNYGVGQDSGHYTLNVDDCEPDCACLPEDFRVESGHDAVPIHASVLQERASSDSPPPRQPHGRDKPSKMQDLPELGSQDSRLPSDRGSVGRRLPAGAHEPGPLGGDAAEAHGATTSGQQVDISRTQGDEHHGDPGDEQYGTSCGIDREFGGRGRPHPGGDANAGQETHPSGDSQGEGDPAESSDGHPGRLPLAVPCLELRGCDELSGFHGQQNAGVLVEEDCVASEGEGCCGGRGQPPLEEESTMVGDAPRQGGGVPVRPLRSNATTDAGSGCLEPDVSQPNLRRPNRGLHQKIKGGLQKVKEVMVTMETVIKDPGKRLMIEVFAGSATVTKVARGGNKWMACPPVDKKYGWDLSRPKDQKNLLGWIKKCQPDLVTLDPPCGPWCGQSSEGLRQDELWERRRLQLPFWRLVAEVWRLQDEAGTLVVVTQPALSQAMHLSFMQDRENVHRAYVPMCSFGLCDPETRQPYEKTMVIEANNGEFLRHLLKGAYCKHGRCGHQSTKGYCKVAGGWARRSDEAARWPEKFGRALLQAADEARVHATAAADWQLHAATSGAGWETMAVASHEVPDEGLRQELARHSMTGERYDFICYDGAANQQPRRLRALVAHLHVTMGHLSNERLSRMLRLSGAKEAAVQLAQALRCQVCAMTRPPLPTPQVAYQKPRSFNERVSGDSFFVWDASGQRFAATHFIDALTDYQVGDLTDTPDSSFAREVFQDLWLSVFGPPDLLITDGGSEFKGGLEAMLDLFGVVHEITPEGAKWRLGQAERHGAVLKLMVMKLVKGMGLKGLKDMRHALLASVAAKNRTLNRGGVSPMQAVTGRNNMIPGSLMQQLSSGQVRFKYNEAVTTSEAVARAERIRIGAIEAFHWLDSHDALRRALASRSRPPHMEGVREGATVYVYDPPANRRGLARRMQDNSSWTGPGIIVCVERDKPIPQRIWVRVRGRVKAFPLEKLRLATVDEMTSADYVTQAVQDVEKELQGRSLEG